MSTILKSSDFFFPMRTGASSFLLCCGLNIHLSSGKSSRCSEFFADRRRFSLSVFVCNSHRFKTNNLYLIESMESDTNGSSMDAHRIRNLSDMVEAVKKGRRLYCEIIRWSSRRFSHHFQSYFWVLCTIWAQSQLLHCKDKR